MSETRETDPLTEEGRDLSALAASGELPPVRFRETEVAQVLQTLARGRSVVVVGPPGAGKTSLVQAVAARLASAGETSGLQGIVEFPGAAFLTGTRYIGEWQTKTDSVLRAAESAGLVLYVPDLWSLPQLGRTSSSDHNVLALLRPAIQAGRLVVLGEMSPVQLATFEALPVAHGLFETVRLEPLGEVQAQAILTERAAAGGLPLDTETLRAVRDLCARFLPRRPSPGPELRLLEQIADTREERRRLSEEVALGVPFVERVFAETSGLPHFVVSQEATRTADEVRAFFTERIVGQRAAIDAVVETIALFKAGLCDPARPIGSFLFVGPTGVGKTELARALATFLFGSPSRLLRFDLSELKDYHAFEQLIGTPRAPEQPARLLDPVRAQPFQVVLFDELEKAHENVWNLLLPLLDEGHLSSAAGLRVDFRSTIVICTSNVGALQGERSVGFSAASGREAATAREARVREALEAAFRPEFLNRFQSTVVFHPLSPEDVRTIARQELKAIFARDGIVRRRVTVEVDDSALDLAARFGFDTRYGARALKRELQRRIASPLAMTLMERSVVPGSVLHVFAREEHIQVRVEDTAESRAIRREATPVPLGDGRKLTRDEAAQWTDRLGAAVESLSGRVDLPALRTRWAELDEAARDPAFWQDVPRATRLTHERQFLRDTVDRLDDLVARVESGRARLNPPPTREALAHLGAELGRLERHLVRTWRELLVFGRDGAQDALVHVAPVIGAQGALAVDFVCDLYLRWAQGRRLGVELLCEPRAQDEPALLAVTGSFPFGLLRGEAGVHRVRRDEETVGSAVVRVLPWTGADGVAEPDLARAIADRRVIKAEGRRGGALRSRLVLTGGPLLQNGRSLAENEALARELLPAWRAAAPAHAVAGTTGADVVRRYTLAPLSVSDALLDETSARSDCLQAEALHDLLCRRADRLSGVPPLPPTGPGQGA